MGFAQKKTDTLAQKIIEIDNFLKMGLSIDSDQEKAKGYFNLALNISKTLLISNPKSGKIHCRAGISYYKLEKFDSSFYHLQKSLSLEPKNPLTSKYLGLVSIIKGNFKEATNFILKAIEIDPKMSNAESELMNIAQNFMLKAEINEKNGDYKSGFSFREKAKDILIFAYNLNKDEYNFKEGIKTLIINNAFKMNDKDTIKKFK